MTDIQKKLEARIAASRALLKTAGEGCDVEKAKDPEALIGTAADVKVEDNKPAGVEIPGQEGLTASGETTECKGTHVGEVPVNGPEVSCNSEVDDFIESAKKVEKTASAMIEFASKILAIPDAAFAGVVKTASAQVTDADVEQYIVKRASEGDPIMQGMLNYCAMMQKVAEGVPADEVAASAEIEANVAEATDQVAQALMEENPEIDEATARQIAEASVAEVLNGAMSAEEAGAAAEEGVEADELSELIDAVKANVIAEVPGVDEATAEKLAVAAVADILKGGEGVGKEASAKKKASAEEGDETGVGAAEAVPAAEEAPAEETPAAQEAAVEDEATEAVMQLAEAIQQQDPSISDEEAVQGAAEALQSIAENGGETEGADVEGQIADMAGQMTMELAEAIQAEDPSISDEEALNGAADAVADALENVQAEQAIGATDEAGAPVVDDATAQAIVDELDKTASAYPMRDAISAAINQKLGLSPEAFKARLA